jgi:hypothetical protein
MQPVFMLTSGGHFLPDVKPCGVTLFANKGLQKKPRLNGVFTANSLVTHADREQTTWKYFSEAGFFRSAKRENSGGQRLGIFLARTMTYGT